jgi:predicted RNase H-like HicB family nuclease
MARQFDVVIERDEEGMYVAFVPQLPGCHADAKHCAVCATNTAQGVRTVVTRFGSIPKAPYPGI